MLGLIIFTILFAIIIYFLFKSSKPGIISKSELILVEKRIYADIPVPLSGQPDMVYKTPDNTLLVVDIKDRKYNEIYKSDIIQLSVYATILKNIKSQNLNTKKVLPYGYILVRKGSERIYKKVNLMSDKQVAQYYHDYLDLMSQKRKPSDPARQGLCDGCAYKEYCR